MPELEHLDLDTDMMETMAIIKVTSAKLIDICQVAKLESGWQVVNVLWVVR